MGIARDISKVFSTSTSLSTDAEIAASYLTTASAAALYAPVSAGGLVDLNTTSFSAVSSQAISAFSSNYDNYRIIVNITTTSADADLVLRFGNSGTADTSSNTQWAIVARTNGGADYSQQASNASEARLAEMETFSGTRIVNVVIDVFNPFAVAETGGTTNISTVYKNGVPAFGAGGFIKGGSTSWSQFFLICSAGNITGTVKTYGYKK